MKAQIAGFLLVFATASVLAADATTTSATTPAETSTASAAAATTTTAVTSQTEKARTNFYGYRLVKKEGQDDKYCRKQKVTGSRTKVIESCLTLEEITALRENSQDMVDRMRNTPGLGGGMDSNGGMTNSAVSNMNTTP